MLEGPPPQAVEQPRFEVTTSRQFTAWMAEQNVSLAFTTYQAGKVFLIGLKPDGRLDIFNRTFERCMGLCITSQTFWLSSLYQLWRFDNALEPNQTYQGYDRLYVPQLAYTAATASSTVAAARSGHPAIPRRVPAEIGISLRTRRLKSFLTTTRLRKEPFRTRWKKSLLRPGCAVRVLHRM